MKKSVIKFFDRIIVLLLGCFGLLYSCEKPKPEYGMLVEYGTPSGEYVLKGIITDKETSNPIQNIQIVQYGDTIYTNAEGKYMLLGHGFNEFHIRIKDIDSVENGGYFQSKEIEGGFTKEDQVEQGDGKWYDGKFVKTLNIELEKKNK